MPTVKLSDLNKPVSSGTTVIDADPEETTAPPTTALSTERDSQTARGHAHNRAVKPPTLALAHGIGELGSMFGVGNFVLDKAVGLGKEIEVILLDHPQVGLFEDKPYGEDGLPDAVFARSVMPDDIAAAEEEVLKRGGSLRKEEATPESPHYRMGANVVILIKAPEGTSEDELGMFPYSIGGQNYAAALWYVRKSAYKSSIASGFGRSRLWLGNKPWGATWRVRTKMETWMKNTYPVPTVSLIGKIDGTKDEASAKLLEELEKLAASFRFAEA